MIQVRTQWPFGDGEMAARIRDLDWAATPLGAISAWSDRLKVMVEQMLASPLVSSLVCGPERVLIYNDAAAKLYGDQHPAVLGRPIPETFPAGWATVAPLYARAFVGETVQVAGQPLDTRGAGVASDVFDALLTPVNEADGRVAYVHMTGSEVADRTRTEAKLRESEARHRLLIESWAQAVWETDADGVVVADSPSWRDYTGQTLDEWLGYGWLDAIHPDDRAYAERQWRGAMAARGLVDAEFRLRAPDGEWRWTNVRAVPLVDADGHIEKWLGLHIDIDDRKRAEAALRDSEERQASLLKLSDVLRPLTEPAEIQAVAGQVLGEHLRVNRAFYVEDEGGEWEVVNIATLFERDVTPPLAGTYSIDLIGRWIVDEFRAGRRVIVRDVRTDERYDPSQRANSEAMNIIAAAGVPLVKGGKVVAVLVIHSALPRDWKEQELELITEAAERIWTAVEHSRAEKALHASEERQAFLLKLSDALRPLADPVDIQNEAARVTGQYLGASRAAYCEIDADGVHFTVHRDFTDGVPSFAGCYVFDSFGHTPVADLRAGRTTYIADTESDARLDGAERAPYAAAKARAALGVPLVKSGQLSAAFFLQFAEPHEWTAEQVALIEEVAERTWAAVERARAEAALRESEERFRQFAAASAAGLWIRDASTLVMEFVSPVIGTIYGVEPDALLGDVQGWAATIVPEDREVALSHLDEARSGEVTVHEFRIQRPSDGTFRWIRNTDFPLRDNGHIPRIGGIAEDVTEAKLAAEHSAVLLAELQHRVRNIMALLRSITDRTAERTESVPEYRDLMMGRLLTFARVQALLTRAANVSVGIASIVRDEVSVQVQHEGQYVIDGPDITLSPKAAEVLTLAIHELATNAVKYGALSVPNGKVMVRWSTLEKRGGPWLTFDWTEEGAPARPAPVTGTPRRRGFGSELIEERVPYELGGRGQVTIDPGGARCHLEFPLEEGASILETGAPQRGSVYGGAIDMTGEPDLTGRRVLVVEDDFYLATDTARALRGAGAEVMGPCATEANARAELEEQRPDAVVVDINLGRGPSFKLAEALKDRGIPFVFTTGYDADVIPAEFEEVERLEKPLQLRQIVSAIAKLAPAA